MQKSRFSCLEVPSELTAAALPLSAFAIAWGSRSARSNIVMLWLLPWLAISFAYTLISLRLQSSDPSGLFSVTALPNRGRGEQGHRTGNRHEEKNTP
ncbi:MAG: hypothetical protein V4675_15635 [Verrucomicrobiota bacterium]